MVWLLRTEICASWLIFLNIAGKLFMFRISLFQRIVLCYIRIIHVSEYVIHFSVSGRCWCWNGSFTIQDIVNEGSPMFFTCRNEVSWNVISFSHFCLATTNIMYQVNFDIKMISDVSRKQVDWLYPLKVQHLIFVCFWKCGVSGKLWY